MAKRSNDKESVVQLLRTPSKDLQVSSYSWVEEKTWKEAKEFVDLKSKCRSRRFITSFSDYNSKDLAVFQDFSKPLQI